MKARSSKCRQPEVGVAQAGQSEVCVGESRPTEVGVVQGGIAELDPGEVEAFEPEPVESEAVESGAPETDLGRAALPPSSFAASTGSTDVSAVAISGCW